MNTDNESVAKMILRISSRPLLSFCLVVSIVTLTAARSRAEIPSAQAPCLGFNPENNSWSTAIVNERNPEENCAAGFAIVSASFHGAPANDAASILLFANCCRLPDGALLDDHVYEPSSCPAGHVASGVKFNSLPDGSSQYLLRCTRINDIRYSLGEPQPGMYVGWQGEFFRHLYLMILGKPETRITRSALPVGIRYAIGRAEENRWNGGTCVSESPGSLLTDKIEKRCGGLQFKPLLQNNKEKSPIAMYPRCRALSSITDPNARCIQVEGISRFRSNSAQLLPDDQPLEPNVRQAH